MSKERKKGSFIVGTIVRLIAAYLFVVIAVIGTEAMPGIELEAADWAGDILDDASLPESGLIALLMGAIFFVSSFAYSLILRLTLRRRQWVDVVLVVGGTLLITAVTLSFGDWGDIINGDWVSASQDEQIGNNIFVGAFALVGGWLPLRLIRKRM